MKRFVFEKYELITELPVDKVIKRLNNSIEGGTFTGKIKDGEFKIVKKINYQNSFLPIVKGTVKFSPIGTRINLNMKPNLFVLGFMVVWVTPFILLFFMLILDMIISLEFSFEFLIPVLFLLFFYYLSKNGFDVESNPSIKILKALFEAREVDEKIRL